MKDIFMIIKLIVALFYAIGFAFMVFCMAKIENERGMKIAMYCGSGALVALAVIVFIKMIA